MKLGHLFAFLAGALLVGFLAWRLGAGYRDQIEVLKATSAVLADSAAVRAAETAQLEASQRRWQEQAAYWQSVAEAVDTVTLPPERPKPDPVVTPPDYAGAVAKLDSVTAERDALWEDNQQLRQRIGRDATKLAAYANLVGSLRGELADVEQQLELAKRDRDDAREERDNWRRQAESAPVAQLPGIGLGKTLDCAIGAAAGALLGELAADKPLVTLSAAGVGCVLNAVQ